MSAWVYEVLPDGFIRIVLKNPPGLALVTVEKCPNYNRPCINKAITESCCLGKLNCRYNDCHNKHCNKRLKNHMPMEGGKIIEGTY